MYQYSWVSVTPPSSMKNGSTRRYPPARDSSRMMMAIHGTHTNHLPQFNRAPVRQLLTGAANSCSAPAGHSQPHHSLPTNSADRNMSANASALALITPSAALAAIVSAMQYQQVELTVPRFTYESSFALKDALQKPGMKQAFTAAADLSGMTGRPELFIQDVYHKAFVAVDEEGTEAAAATAVVVGLTAMPAEPLVVNVDGPFLFLIRDVATGAVLFLGHVVNPA